MNGLVKQYLTRMDDELLARDGSAELSHEEAKQALRDVYLLSCGGTPEFHPSRVVLPILTPAPVAERDALRSVIQGGKRHDP